MGHLESHVDQLQRGLDTSQRNHQLSKAPYGELFGRAESCYTDLSNTKRAYDQTEQCMQAQLLGISNRTKFANAEIGRLETQVQQLEEKNNELSESRQSQPASSYEVVPDETLHVPRTIFDKLAEGSD